MKETKDVSMKALRASYIVSFGGLFMARRNEKINKQFPTKYFNDLIVKHVTINKL